MVNPHRGEASIELAGRTYVVWYGWPGVAMLRSDIGEDFDIKITQAMATLDMPVLAGVLAIGLRDSWPGVTGDDIAKLSPPIRPVCDAISLSLRRTFHGEAEVPAEPEGSPPQSGRLRQAFAKMWSWMRIGPRSSPA